MHTHSHTHTQPHLSATQEKKLRAPDAEGAYPRDIEFAPRCLESGNRNVDPGSNRFDFMGVPLRSDECHYSQTGVYSSGVNIIRATSACKKTGYGKWAPLCDAEVGNSHPDISMATPTENATQHVGNKRELSEHFS